MKMAEWKKITNECQSMGIAITCMFVIYFGRTLNVPLCPREIIGASGGKYQKLTSLDELVFEIIGKDSPIIEGIGVDDIIGVEDMEGTIIDQISIEGTTKVRETETANAAAEVVIEVATTPTKEITLQSKILSYKEFSAQKRKKEQIDDMADHQFKKSKLKLQIEYLELQNYKTKLEILSRKKYLPPSKYSTSIETNFYSTN